MSMSESLHKSDNVATALVAALLITLFIAQTSEHITDKTREFPFKSVLTPYLYYTFQKMKFFFIFLFCFVSQGVLIVTTTAKEKCTQKHLPFPAVCATNCPGMKMKPYCVYYVLTHLEKSFVESHEIIIYSDDDVLFSNTWNETRVSDFVRRFGDDKLIATTESQAYPPFYMKKRKIEGPYINAGFLVGKRQPLTDMLLKLAEVQAEAAIRLPDTTESGKKLKYPYFRTLQFDDQSTISAFYWASPGKPIVKDDDRILGFVMIDIQSWVPQNKTQYAKCVLPAPYPVNGMPGDDVCNDLTMEGHKPLGAGVCQKKKQSARNCNRALEFDGCFIRPSVRHPLGVLQKVEDPLVVHFAGGQQKKNFKLAVVKQNQMCESPYRYQDFKIPDLPPTALFLTSAKAIKKIIGPGI